MSEQIQDVGPPEQLVQIAAAGDSPTAIGGECRIAFDPIDRLPITTTLPELQAIAGRNATATATEIHRQGARGHACRRLLARDIVLSRTQLRYMQGLRNVLLQRFADGLEGPDRVRLLEQLVDGDHRRLLSTISALARLEGTSPVVHVSAHQLAVVVNEAAQR